MRVQIVPWLLGLAACGATDPGADALAQFPDADLSQPEHVRALAQLASPLALRVYAGGLLGEGLVDAGPDGTIGDEDCVDYRDDRDADGLGEVELLMRCSDEEGAVNGRYVGIYREDGSVRLVAHQVDSEWPVLCGEDGLEEARSAARVEGWMELQPDGGFEINLVRDVDEHDDDCQPVSDRFAVAYTGRMEGAWGETVTTFSGSGTLGARSIGQASVEVVDRVDDTAVCGSEASRGSLTLTAGKDVAVVTFDGESRCDEDATAAWSLNGVDQGEAVGLGCSSVSAAPPWLAGGGLLVVLAGVLCRRSGSSRDQRQR